MEKKHVQFSNEEKSFLLYEERHKLIQFFCKSQRQRQQRFYISDMVKVKGKIVYAAPSKNRARISLYDLNNKKLIRKFINIDDTQDMFNRAIHLIENKLFICQQLDKCAYILQYDFFTGNRTVIRDHQGNLIEFPNPSRYNFIISNNGELFAFKNDWVMAIFTNNLDIIQYFKGGDDFKFSECSQYLIHYNEYQVPLHLSVIDIKKGSQKFYLIRFRLNFVSIKDKILHTIQRKGEQMIYIKIKL